MRKEIEVAFEFACTELPGAVVKDRRAVRLGIQEGRAVVQDVAGDMEEVTFRFSLRVREHPRNGRPNFLGPFAQGTPDGRFVYLCWGERADGEWDGFRRAKVHLKSLTWAQIDRSVATGLPIRATIRMSDAGGRPATASLGPDHVRWE
jgi:uncharacterized protein DUF5990